jgi:phosphoglycerol transferase MdoB-like AlkP superfamily enzyme
MTYFHINIMWAIVLFGILLWTTVCVVLNAALRRGMGTMGMVLSYSVLVWMLIDLPVRDALTTWAFFAALGGSVIFVYELWARRRYADTGRTPSPLVRLEGILRWPAMVPDAFGLVLNDLGVLPRDDRSETQDDDPPR